MKAKNKIMHYLYLKNNPTALMFENNQILYMRFQCIDMYECPILLDMPPSLQPAYGPADMMTTLTERTQPKTRSA